MADTTRAKDGAELLEIIARLSTKSPLSVAERETLRIAFRPFVWSVVRNVVWRRGRSNQAYEAAIEDAAQQAWLLLFDEILPSFVPTRGNVFAFVVTCLRFGLLDWLRREESARVVSLAHPERLADTHTNTPELTDAAEVWLRSVLAKAALRDRQVFRRRIRGRSYAEIGRELGMSEGAVRLVMFRLMTRLRESARLADV